MKKGLLAVLLCVIMVMALLPATAFATHGDCISYTTTDDVTVTLYVETDPSDTTPGTVKVGDGLASACNSDVTTVTLPEVITDSGESYKVTTVSAIAFNQLQRLKSVSLAGVTDIRENAFCSCTALNSIDIPKVRNIGSLAFSFCSSLQSVSLPKVETIGSQAFYSCGSLRSVSLPKVETIGDNAFFGCGSLQSVTIWQTRAPSLGSGCIPTDCTLYVPQGARDNYCSDIGWPSTIVELWPVTGTVYDENGMPAANATVSVYGIATETNSSGAYTVYVRPGEATPATITASITGAGTRSITVSNVTGALTDKDFYFGKVASPTFSPDGGTHTGWQLVAISCGTSDANIRYTTDGSEPTELDRLCSGKVAVSSTSTLKAKAFKTGFEASNTASAIYTINNGNATSVWIAGEELTSENPYYHNGSNGALGTVDNNAAGYNAYFNAAAGTLTLNGLSVVDSTVTTEMLLGTAIVSPAYAIFAKGNLTICVDGDSSVSVGSFSKIDDNAFSLAINVTGELTVQPGVTGEGSLTAESKGAMSSGSYSDFRGTSICSGVTSRTLKVKSGVTLTGTVSDTAAASVAYSIGVNADSIIVTGGTLKGIVSGEVICGEGDADYATSWGIIVNNGDLSLSAGSVEATGGNALSEASQSTGVALTNPTDRINITGGSFTAKSGTAGTTVAVQNPLTLGSGITAKGSASSDGTNPVTYAGADNETYKWVETTLLPVLSVAATPSGSVVKDTVVTLRATPINIDNPTYQWYSNTIISTEDANEITGATANTYAPPTNTAGTVYYYCVAEKESGSGAISVTSNIVSVTVNQPSGGDDTPSPVTVYNDPSVPDATVWLTGSGLGSSDLLVTERDPKGSAYKALLKLANSDDVFATYNIYLRSGKKGTGFAMNLTFDLNAKYAGNDFTLVHQKADSTFEYFYDTADANGDLTFGPLYELSPFMLVKGTLTPASMANVVDIPKTGDNTQPELWAGIALLACAGLTASLVLARRKRWNG